MLLITKPLLISNRANVAYVIYTGDFHFDVYAMSIERCRIYKSYQKKTLKTNGQSI